MRCMRPNIPMMRLDIHPVKSDTPLIRFYKPPMSPDIYLMRYDRPLKRVSHLNRSTCCLVRKAQINDPIQTNIQTLFVLFSNCKAPMYNDQYISMKKSHLPSEFW